MCVMCVCMCARVCGCSVCMYICSVCVPTNCNKFSVDLSREWDIAQTVWCLPVKVGII